MSGDSFKPESEDLDAEIITPDTGDDNSAVQAETGDAWDAASREVLDSHEGVEIESSVVESDELAEVDEEAPSADEVSDSTDDESGDDDKLVDEVTEQDKAKAAWDGNPANLPDELKPVYQNMEQHFHQTNTTNAAKGRELDALLAENRALNAEMRGKGATGENADSNSATVDGPPPLPSGDNVTQEQWDTAQDERGIWFGERALQHAIEKGEVITPDQLKQQAEAQRADEDRAKESYQKLSQREGFTPEIKAKMHELSSGNQFYAQMLSSDDGLATLMDAATQSLENMAFSASQTETNRKALQTTQHDSQANSRSVTRAGSTPAPKLSAANLKRGTVEDRFAAAGKFALENS